MRTWQFLAEGRERLLTKVAASDIEVLVEAPEFIFGISAIHRVSVCDLFRRKRLEKFGVLQAFGSC